MERSGTFSSSDMFADAGAADEDFGEFGANRKLASLFGGGGASDVVASRRNSAAHGGASSDLKYSAPKQPTKDQRGASASGLRSGAGAAAGGVMHALPVHAFRYVEGRAVSEGSLGAAVVAAPASVGDESRRFSLLLYRANKEAASTAPITPTTPALVAGVDGGGAHYVQFNPDAAGHSWSLSVASAGEAQRFCAHVALAQALSEVGVTSEVAALHVMDAAVGEGHAVSPDDGIEIRYTGWLVQGKNRSHPPHDGIKSGHFDIIHFPTGSVVRGRASDPVLHASIP